MTAKALALVFGVIFVVAGLLGYVSNPLFGAAGFFLTNHFHDLVHLVIGLILLAVAIWVPAQSVLWLKSMGVVYLILAILGFLLVPAGGMLLGLALANTADHWLHVVFGIALIAAGYWASDAAAATDTVPRAVM